MSADNVVIIEKGKDGKFRGYHRSYSAWTEGQYDVGSQCPCIDLQIAGDAGSWEDCDICAGTGIVKARKETPVFEADTIERAIYAYDEWLEEMNDNKEGFPFIVEYGYEFVGLKPNKETLEAIKETGEGKDLHTALSIDEFIERLENAPDPEINIDATKHAGDCPVYACLENGSPECGVCTCGYGWKCVRKGDWSQMYSKELVEKLRKEKNKE